MRNPAGVTLLVVLLLAAFGVEWGRSLLHSGEGAPALAVEVPYALLLGPGFPRPGVHQYSDAQTPLSVIEVTGLSLSTSLREDPCLNRPLASGAGLDVLRNDKEIQDVVVFWMPAAQRLALAIPLDVDRMSRRDWASLPGVGPVLARRLDQDRQKNGEFGSIEALVRVHGVGKHRLKAWRRFFAK